MSKLTNGNILFYAFFMLTTFWNQK